MGERAKLTDHPFLIRMAGVALGPFTRAGKNLKAKRFYVDTIFKNGGHGVGVEHGAPNEPSLDHPTLTKIESKTRAPIRKQNFSNGKIGLGKYRGQKN
jgi:hypothetical protein